MTDRTSAGLRIHRPGAISARVLCFAPHPDDEVAGPGGTLYLHAQAGDALRVVLATDGTAGDPEGRFSDADYGARRREESRRAAAVLGLSQPEFLGLTDGGVVRSEDRVHLEGLIVHHVQDFAPDLVFLPWSQDQHPDHLVLHQVAVAGLRKAAFRGRALGYEVWSPMSSPHWIVDITDVVEDKRRALSCFESQLAYSDLGHAVFGLNGYRSLALEKSRGYGEVFEEIEL